MSINTRSFNLLAVALLSLVLAPSAFPHEPDEKINGLRPELVADFIFSVIEADRTLYTRKIVERMQETRTVITSESWEHRNALPLPSQMIMMAGKRVESKGDGLRYRLASLWPIYEKNGPHSDFERQGLKAVQEHPDEPFSGTIYDGQQKYFQAIYSDRAVSKACVNCHNSHVLSPKHDYRLNDVMGGVIISFPID